MTTWQFPMDHLEPAVAEGKPSAVVSPSDGEGRRLRAPLDAAERTRLGCICHAPTLARGAEERPQLDTCRPKGRSISGRLAIVCVDMPEHTSYPADVGIFTMVIRIRRR